MYDADLRDRPARPDAQLAPAPSEPSAVENICRARATLDVAWRTKDARLKALRLEECAARLREAAQMRSDLAPALLRELEWAELSARCLAQAD